MTLDVSIYSRINSTKYPASDARHVGQPRLMSLVGRVRIDQCVPAVKAMEAPVLVCLRSICNHVTEVVGRYGTATGAEGCRGLCEFNPTSFKSLSCEKCL